MGSDALFSAMVAALVSFIVTGLIARGSTVSIGMLLTSVASGVLFCHGLLA
eukprot:CAMPEP_0203886834 /NCGR_PEP_ID=MMETSP0359-20131031/30616_1 /ASSEMBLY_ACC=CAM_ASM_000338 /TAXON_ID=268821 /ORGANISM="Scrippsiella Hangoei, Strain SHTV-5" /LENGTH=50 /DNA_ID=CAMNT_0050807741 /DNA_START=56 /DNA_END=204 /DNA_ORIENTATION=+